METEESLRRHPDDLLHPLDRQAERRDLLPETTGDTPDFMSAVRGEFIASVDEEFLITCQENNGRTRGRQPGDFGSLIRITGTILYRTVPPGRDARRSILDMPWAAEKDLGRGPIGDDRSWEQSDTVAAKRAR